MAGGTTTGRSHLLAERPNQDAFRLLQGEWGAAAAVCDGCGSEPGSGVGAALGANLAVNAAARRLKAGGPLDLGGLRREILGRLEAVGGVSGLPVREYLLFTLLLAILSEGRAWILACGDGLWGVDGEIRTLGPYPGNAPPYIAYGLENREGPRLEVLYEGPAREVLIGTDGASEVPPEILRADERIFANPDLLRRRLKLAKPSDDATVAMLRMTELSEEMVASIAVRRQP